MATRPVFIPIFESDSLVKKDSIDFQYYSGFSVGQKQKSIVSLHEQYMRSMALKTYWRFLVNPKINLELI